MYVLIAYDISTISVSGSTRLRKVSKACQNYGQRVQNSLFECCIDYGTFLKLKKELEGIIDPKTDSLRYYNMGNKWEKKVEHVGAKPTYNVQDALII